MQKLAKREFLNPQLSKKVCIKYPMIRLITFAMSKNLLISSTFFPHKSIRKQTWMSLNETIRNQIDHVVTDNIIKHWI